MLSYVKFPTWWFERHNLAQLSWARHGVSAEAALMIMLVMIHNADQGDGSCRLTYNEIQNATGLSKTSIAGGLGILEGNLISKKSNSNFCIIGFNPERGYAFSPAKNLYDSSGALRFFNELKKRKYIELDALKIYFTFMCRRDRKTNYAHMTYDQINAYSGVNTKDIRSALSLLIVHKMIHVDILKNNIENKRISSGYRITHLEPRKHMGTTNRDL